MNITLKQKSISCSNIQLLGKLPKFMEENSEKIKRVKNRQVFRFLHIFLGFVSVCYCQDSIFEVNAEKDPEIQKIINSRNPEIQNSKIKNPEIQKSRNPEIQKSRNSKSQKFKNQKFKIQKFKIQKFKNPEIQEIQKSRNSRNPEIQKSRNSRNSKIQSFKNPEIQKSQE